MKGRLILVGHVVVNERYLVISKNADLEPPPPTMEAGTVTIKVAGGEVVELRGRAAGVWWRYISGVAHAPPDGLILPPIMLHAHDIEQGPGAADVVG